MKIDWLTAVSDTEFKITDIETGEVRTGHNITAEEMLGWAEGMPALWDLASEWEYCSPLAHCRITIVSAVGIKLSVLSTGNLMLTAPGQACATLGTEELLSLMLRLRHSWHITRIDVALDLSPDVGAAEIWADAGQTSASGRARQTQLIVSSEKLATAYFGRRTSDTFVRVYDKVHPDAQRSLRFETEIKGSLARHLLANVVDEGDILERLSYLCQRGQMLVNSPVLTEKIEKITSEAAVRYEYDVPSEIVTKLRWFDKQVLPAFIKLLITNPDAAREIIRRMHNISFAE